MASAGGCATDMEQSGAQRAAKAAKSGKQQGRSAPKQVALSASSMGYDVMAEQAALAALKLGWDWQQASSTSQHLDQWAPQTALLRGQLAASEAERERLQQELDALRSSHKALARRYSKLKQQAEGSLGQDQLQVLQQQLAEANRFLAQQQETNTQQAAQLQQALGELAAAAERCEAEQQQLKQQLAAMAAAVAAADAAARRALGNEAAMLQAMTHLVQEQAAEQAKFQTEKGQRQQQHKEQLATAWGEASRVHNIVAEVEMKLLTAQTSIDKLAKIAADANMDALHAECKMARMQLSVRDTNAKWEQYKKDTDQQLQRLVAEHKQLAAADQARLAGPVAQLRRLLEGSDGAEGCEVPLTAAAGKQQRSGLLSGALQRVQNWVIRSR